MQESTNGSPDDDCESIAIGPISLSKLSPLAKKNANETEAAVSPLVDCASSLYELEKDDETSDATPRGQWANEQKEYTEDTYTERARRDRSSNTFEDTSVSSGSLVDRIPLPAHCSGLYFSTVFRHLYDDSRQIAFAIYRENRRDTLKYAIVCPEPTTKLLDTDYIFVFTPSGSSREE